jgi:oligosaccharide repeat unit polymerase
MAATGQTRTRPASFDSAGPTTRSLDSGVPVGWVVPSLLLIASAVFFVLHLVRADAADLQSAAALAITAAPFLVAAREAPNRLLHPLSVFGFTMVLGVAGQTIYLTHGKPPVLPELLSGFSAEILDKGLIVTAVAVALLLIGYAVSRPPIASPKVGSVLGWATRRGMGRPDSRRVLWISLGLCLLSLVAFAIYAPKVGLTSPAELLSSRKRFVRLGNQVLVYGYLRFLIGLCSIGFLLITYTITRNRLSWRSPLGLIALVSLVMTAAFATISSSRTELFATLATAVFIVIGLRRREPKTTTIAMVVVAALAAISLLAGLRAAGQGQTGASASASTGTAAVLENAVGSRDWMDIGPLSVVTHRVPDAYPYQYGKTLVSILWVPIPRTLWASKPPVRIGPEIGPPVFGFPASRVSGDPPGIVGELWINGSYFAVVIGMFLLGVLIKRLSRWYRLVELTDGLSAIVFGIMIVATCLQLPITDVTGVLIPLLENFLVLSIGLWLARSRDGRAAACESPGPAAAKSTDTMPPLPTIKDRQSLRTGGRLAAE